MNDKPEHNPDVFPPGSGKVGDTVLLVTWRNRSAQIVDQETWSTLQMKIVVMKITRVGIRNEHGYYLDIEVRANKKTKPKIISPNRNTFGVYRLSKEQPVVLILAPAEEQPAELRAWTLAQKPPVIVVRNPAASPPQFGVRCGKCLGELLVEVTTTEAATLRWWDRFCTDDPEQVDSEPEKLLCQDCQTIYKLPPNLEYT
jgi:hypothetical protein